jgi:hypothetical protein
MALNKDILGTALFNYRQTFNNKTANDLITTHGNLDNARLEFAKGEAEIIIEHFKTYAVGIYQAASLTAGATAVTSIATPNIKIE